YLELNEELLGTTQSAFIPGLIFGGASISTADRFSDRNYFYGGQVGADLTVCRGRLSVDVLGKVALGDVHEGAGIDGRPTVRPFTNVSVTVPSGGFALPSISGRSSRDEFAVLPEVGVNFGFEVTRHLRATVGYSFLYLSNAYRPGDLIDRTLNLS